jgi:hypothetical protein
MFLKKQLGNILMSRDNLLVSSSEQVQGFSPEGVYKVKSKEE